MRKFFPPGWEARLYGRQGCPPPHRRPASERPFRFWNRVQGVVAAENQRAIRARPTFSRPDRTRKKARTGPRLGGNRL